MHLSLNWVFKVEYHGYALLCKKTGSEESVFFQGIVYSMDSMDHSG